MPSPNRVAHLSLVSLTVLLISLAAPVLAHADDGSPPPEATAEPVDPPQQDLPSEEAAPAPEEATVAQVLEQAPEGTEVVVVDDSGAPVDLATEAAAEIIAVSDPMWCPDGLTPGHTDCSPAQDSMTDLLTWLIANDPDADGTIWIEASYDSGSNVDDTGQDFVIDGGDYTNLDLHSLTVQGGWSGGNDTNVDTSDPSEFNGYLWVTGWQGDVTLNDLLVLGTTDIGMYIETTGDVSADRIESSENDLEGMMISAGGQVDLTDATFVENGFSGYTYSDSNSFFYIGGSGVSIDSGGNVTLTRVESLSNAMDGATILVDNAAAVTAIDSTFSYNGQDYFVSEFNTESNGSESYSLELAGGSGLYVDAESGKITLNGVLAAENAGHGAQLYSDNGDIEIVDSVFTDNGYIGRAFASLYEAEELDLDSNPVYLSNSFYLESYAGSGLGIDTNGAVSLSGVYATYNANNGAEIDADGLVEVSDGSVFAANGWSSGIFDGCGCGYDIIEELLFSEDVGGYGLPGLCEVDNPPTFDTFVFDPCNPDHIDYLDLYGPNVYFSAGQYTSDADYLYSESYWGLGVTGGRGLKVDTDGGITLTEVGAYENSHDGADLDNDDSPTLITVTDGEFDENGWIGDLWVSEFAYYFEDGETSSAYQSLDMEIFYADGLSAYNDDGSILYTDVRASDNANDGSNLWSGASVSVGGQSDFLGNGSGELVIGGEGLFGEFLCNEGVFGTQFCDEIELDSSTLEINVSGSEGDSGEGYESSISVTVEATAGSGLDAGWAGTGITLTNVAADGNRGYGASLDSGTFVSVTGGTFNANGDGLQAYLDLCLSDDGCEYYSVYSSSSSGLLAYAEDDITVTGVEASSNALDGAELYSDALDSVLVVDSVFEGNGYGADAFFLYEDDETFEMGSYEGSGIFADSAGNIYLINVEANGNDTHGAHLVSGGNASICNSSFSSNGGYGVEAADVAGALTLSDVVFAGNSSGEYDYPGSAVVTSGINCLPSSGDNPGGPELPWNYVPVDGGEQVGLDCDSFAGTRLELESGDHALLPCPIRDAGGLTQSLVETLPAEVSDEFTFQSGMTLVIVRDGAAVDLIEDGFATVAFTIPDGVSPEDLVILWWNGTEWIELEDVEGDGRVVAHAGYVTDEGFFAASVNFTGTFILAEK